MARPREFDENTVLDAAMECFWRQGYEATSIRDLIEGTGITGASIYNAFGDKRALFRRALDRYVDTSIAERIRRCRDMPPREAIAAFLAEILDRSLSSPDHRGCMLVNAAMEIAPQDPDFQRSIAEVLAQIEAFFLERVRAGQEDGSIRSLVNAEDLARHLVGVLMGMRVLARVRPERALLEGVVSAALVLLDSEAARDAAMR